MRSARPKKPVGRPFAKGRSGNPAGRPKTPTEFTDAARALSPRALDKLVELMDSGPAAVAARCAEFLVERAWGRAPQPIVGGDGGPLLPMTMTPERAIDVHAALGRAIERAKQRAELPPAEESTPADSEHG